MTPIERQILKNQSTILLALSELQELSIETENSISERMQETFNLFKDKKQEPCCEMPKGCGKKIIVMNCPNWICGEDNCYCKECGGKYALSKDGEDGK